MTLIDCDHRTPPAATAGLPYVAIPQLKGGRLDLSDVRLITADHFAEWTRKANPKAFDVVLSRRCNPGETAFVPPGLAFAVGQNLVLLRSDGTTVLPEFLRWLVRGPAWWEQIEKFINVGAVFDSLRCADVPRFELPIPPKEDQRSIANILGTLDDKIELNQRMNATLEAMARALFKSWFVDFEPVRAKIDGRTPTGIDAETAKLFPGELADSKLGRIPAGWRVSRLGDVLELKRGYDLPTAQRLPGKVPIVSSSGPSGFHSEGKVSAPGIVTGRYGTIGRVFLVHEDFWPLNTTLYVCDFKGTQVLFAYHLLLGLDYDKFSDKAAVPGINRNHVHEESVVCPPVQVQSRFDAIAGVWANLAQLLMTEAQTLSSLRDELLPHLLSGEISVTPARGISKTETAAEAAG